MALFTNIPHEEGVLATEEALDEREIQIIHTEYIVDMLKLILQNNIFSFDNELYSQEEGTSMGPRHAPHFSDIFMARKIDPTIEVIFRRYENNIKDINFLQRFLDDMIKIFLEHPRIYTIY